MATSFLKPPTLRPPQPLSFSSGSYKFFCLGFKQPRICCRIRVRRLIYSGKLVDSPLSTHFLSFASHGEATETETATSSDDPIQENEQIPDNSDGAVDDDESETENADAGQTASVVISSLQLYKEASESHDESKMAEIESFLKSIEDEKNDVERKMATLAEELSYEKDRILRISADFDNFRKRTERERVSVVTNAKGEVVENLLPILDNFERAKAQIKVETETEEKINYSYQNIYKQFMEVLGSLGVAPVETIGNPFDPMLHEAIMREESFEFEDGIILEEYRKGFKLGDRLLRPSMVKVSAGPGPKKPESAEASGEAEDGAESNNGVQETESTGEH